MLNTDIRRDDRGVDRCARTIMKAIHNVPNDDSKGFHNVAAVCNMPIVQRISDGVKGCPHCDKEPPVGNVHPKVINSASISLTEKELQECGVTGKDPSLAAAKKRENPAKIARKVAEKRPVEGKVKQVKKDVIELAVTLDQLEQTDDIARLLIDAAVKGFDKLPITNFGESKRVIRLQERLEKLLEA